MADASFLEEVRADSAGGGGTCSVGQSLELMPDDLAEQVRAAMDDVTVHGTAITRALKARGFVVADGAVQRHRRGACRCA